MGTRSFQNIPGYRWQYCRIFVICPYYSSRVRLTETEYPGYGFDSGELETERDNMLIGAFEEEQMLGCCMLVEENRETVRLRQMAVLNDLQGKGIGRALMSFAENIARDRGYKTLSMHARKNAIGFYEKMGYRVAGEEFTEVTIPHYVMEKDL